MAYFSNGSEGMAYESRWCDRCVHQHPVHSCPCWDVHMLYNYEECNNPASILHKMIPLLPSGGNGVCLFFIEDAGKHNDSPAKVMASIREQCFGKNNG